MLPPPELPLEAAQELARELAQALARELAQELARAQALLQLLETRLRAGRLECTEKSNPLLDNS